MIVWFLTFDAVYTIAKQTGLSLTWSETPNLEAHTYMYRKITTLKYRQRSNDTPDRRHSKTLLTIDERVSKNRHKTVFSNAFCRQLGDKWQSKTLFLTILIYIRQYY